ncbi:MAG: SPOR domain-containing protein [Marinilabiliaceae bacterium]
MSKNLKYTLRILTLAVIAFFVTVDGHADKLSELRTKKKIVPVREISAPYYAIQILALKKSPQNPSFFKSIDRAREFECRDGYVRYTVGRYESKKEAQQSLSDVKSNGYPESFIVDIRDYDLKTGGGKSKDTEIDPDKTYTVQIAAYRYPVYKDHFEEFDVDEVLEFYPDDKVYRYTVGEFKGSDATDELKKVKEKGYPNARLVPLEEYKPFRIE